MVFVAALYRAMALPVMRADHAPLLVILVAEAVGVTLLAMMLAAVVDALLLAMAVAKLLPAEPSRPYC